MATFLKPQDQENTNVPQVGAPATNVQQAQSAAPAPKRQGSGQFTNIQSYLNANKGAGQKLAQGVGNQVQKTLDPVKTQAQQYNDQVRQGIQSAQNTLQQGQGQLGQLKQIGSNIQANTGDQFYGQDKDLGINSFTQSPSFSDFQRIQQGQGVNEDQLNLQQQAFANQANQYNQLSQEQANLAGNESGRFDLLKKSFGGNVNPKYTSGQQRLDQLFLARQGLGGLRQDLKQNINQAKNLQAQTQETGQGTRLAQEQERSLLGDIDTQAKTNEDNYLKMLESYAPELQKRRDKEFEDLSNRYASMKTPSLQAGGLLDRSQPMDKNGNPIGLQKAQAMSPVSGLTADDLKLLGVNKANSMFDVFNKTKLDQVARTGAKVGQNAKAYQDVANQKNVEDYSSLAKILGMDEGAKRLVAPSTLEKSIIAQEGAANLQNRLDSAKDEFYRKMGQDVYGNSLNLGGSGWANQHGISGADILAGKNIMGSDRGISSAGTSFSELMSKDTYNKFLNNLKNTGFGNVLSTEGNVSNALSGIKPTLTEKNMNLGELRDSGGTIRNYGTNMDEQIKKNLESLGVDTSKISNLKGKDKINTNSEFKQPTVGTNKTGNLDDFLSYVRGLKKWDS